MAKNNYDGYAPHHHWCLLDIPPDIYAKLGIVFPDSTLSPYILHPYRAKFVRDNVEIVGYGYLEKVEPQHIGFYAFYDRHDGIDGQPTPLVPNSKLYGTIYTKYKNSNGVNSSCEIYGVTEVLGENECWLQLDKGYVKGYLKGGSSYLYETKYKDVVVNPVWEGAKLTARKGE